MMLGTVAAVTTAGWATTAVAQDDAAFRTAMMARCATIGDKAARLACYDAAQRSGPIAMPAPSSGGSASVAAAAPAYSPPVRASGSEFGMESARDARRRLDSSNGPNEIRARAVSATDNGSGYWLIKLDNGASWKLAEYDSMFRPPNRNTPVRIRKGAMGGYLMDVDKQQAIRVVRVD